MGSVTMTTNWLMKQRWTVSQYNTIAKKENTVDVRVLI